MKQRQDAWLESEDLLLAETVLRHVRDGSTQLNAFEEVGDKLERTSAACGFRWNAIVRQQYEQALALAKKHRKQRQRLLGLEQSRAQPLYQPPAEQSPSLPFTDIEHTPVSNLSLDVVIAYLRQLEQGSGKTEHYERLVLENKALREQHEKLEQTIHDMEQEGKTMRDDYETLLQIMNRARKLVLFNEEPLNNAFKMERNGNLEKLMES